MKTIKYYTSSGLYKGWNKYNNKNLQESREWIRNGHTIKIIDKQIK